MLRSRDNRNLKIVLFLATETSSWNNKLMIVYLGLRAKHHCTLKRWVYFKNLA